MRTAGLLVCNTPKAIPFNCGSRTDKTRLAKAWSIAMLFFAWIVDTKELPSRLLKLFQCLGHFADAFVHQPEDGACLEPTVPLSLPYPSTFSTLKHFFSPLPHHP